MKNIMHSANKSIFVVFFFLILPFGLHAMQAQTPFTFEDALNVKSVNNQILSNDGLHVAGIIRDSRARFGTDHFRFQDPGYVNIPEGELVVINTESGDVISLYKEPVRVSSLTWSPNGKELIFFLQKNEKLQLMHYSLESGRVKQIQIKNGGERLSGSTLLWNADGSSAIVGMRHSDWFTISKKLYEEATAGPIVVYDGSQPFLKWDAIRNQNQLEEIYLVNLAKGNAVKLLDEGAYQGLNVIEDGSGLVFNQTFPIKTSYKRGEGSEFEVGVLTFSLPDSIQYIYKRNKSRRNYNWNKAVTKYAWVDSGNVHVAALNSNAEPVNLTKGKAYSDEKKKKEVRFSIMEWSPKDDALLLSSDKGYWVAGIEDGSLEMVYEFPEGEAKESAPNLRMLKWSPDARFLYFSSSAKKEWHRGFVRFDLESKTWEELILDSNQYTGVQFSDNANRVIFNWSNGDYPSELMVSDVDFKNIRVLTNLNPWVKSKKWTRSELIAYRDADGTELQGILYYPVDYDSTKKYPLVAEIYETFFENGYRNSMNILANAGYFGLRPSVDLEMGYPGEAWIKGITSAINKLVEEGKVDNDKVGVHGTSYGGYATSLLITQTDRFAAAINISGKVNIISFLGDSPKIGTRNYNAAEQGQDRIGGTFWDEPLKYFATSAVFYADRIKTPHLLLTGEGDWNVPGTNSRELYYAMRRLGKDVTWVNYMNGGHGAGWASDENDYKDQWNRILNFYAKHFKAEGEGKEEAPLVRSQN